MSRSRLFIALLLAGTGLAGQPVLAQEDAVIPPPGGDASNPESEAEAAEDTQEEVDISAPGGEGLEIIVTGRFIPEPVRNTAQVISVLSAEEIARTGDGEVSDALQRVTGLSVNEGGFVYVRGLGDRYSLALLNGLALPSPEPLRRVVPLDIFPTSIVSSAVVQKSYSVNYPGEYGGGVINLTTAALPDENYFTMGAGVEIDGETTGHLGYTYYGSKYDIIGYDDGTRDLPTALRDNGGELVTANVLENEDTLILQRNLDIPANFSAAASGGYAQDLGDTRIGVLGSLGFSNEWETRGSTQETALAGSLVTHSYGVRTENRVMLNGLLSVGADLPDGHKLRWTNVYIHDTSKVARVRGAFENIQTAFEDLDPERLTGPYDSLNYESSFIERQLWTSQVVGEFEWDNIEVDLRGSFANSQRKSPYERTSQYRYIPSTGGYAIRFGSPTGVIFSDLDEDVWSAGADIAYEPDWEMPVKFSAGYAFNDISRTFESLNFVYDDGGSIMGPNDPNSYLPIYQILSPEFIELEEITLRQSNRAFGQAQYIGDLTTHAGYLRADAELVESVRLEAGVRYEKGEQSLTLPDLYANNPAGAGVSGVIENNNEYWLPAATLTWNFAEDFQLRVHGSKTIARPQFRELGTIPVLDVESDRLLAGNPFLIDSQLYNAEMRAEYYPGTNERLSLAGFYKRLKNPIESIATVDAAGNLTITNANAPEAQLYGFEAEAVKYFDFVDMGFDGEFFSTRQLFISANYTYSKSKLKVGADDTTTLFPGNIDSPLVAPASQVFIDGNPLTGQSEHLANLQIGFEDTERLSQLTFLLTYASERVTSRGANTGGVVDPDIVENPGFNLDIVAREMIEIDGIPAFELKVAGRNLLGTPHEEVQNFPGREVPVNNYDVGRTVSVSASVTF